MKGVRCPEFSFWKSSTFFLLVLTFLVSGCNFPPYTLARLESHTATMEAVIPAGEYHPADIFAAYFSTIPDALELFGAPISDAFTDPTTGRTMQYFQKVRFEVDAENKNSQVQLTPLGTWLLPEETQQAVIIDENCVTLPDQQIPLCSAFRTYYEKHNGAQMFGKPISYVFQTGNKYYQYFENVCLIYSPSAPENLQVTLANLGEIYLLSKEPYYQAITHADVSQSLMPRNKPVQELSVQIAFADPFIAASQQQIVYVQVLNAAYRPEPNVTLQAVATFPDGSRQQYRLHVTDNNGVSSFAMTPFTGREMKINDMIVIEIFARSELGSGHDSGWFRIWE